MSGTVYKVSAVIVSLLLSAMLAACGSDNKEGAGNPAAVALVDETTCRVCHGPTVDPLSKQSLLTGYLGSPHNRTDAGCQGCHGGGAQHFGVGPIPFPHPSDRCSVCHNGTVTTGLTGTTYTATFGDPAVQAEHLASFLPSAGGAGNCGVCHNPHDPINAPLVGGNCISCHSFPLDWTGKGIAVVNDNSGVRAVVAEFSKWSHHVTGVTLNPAHCAACHLEGTVKDGQVVVDTTKHMVDAKVHLRDVKTDGEFEWDPAAPNHSNMDNFCMNCHSAAGATSPVSLQIQAFINSNRLTATGKTASPRNPFGDTISNRYDKMQRPGVTNVSDQFNTTNNSHHAVKGPRYSGRTRTAGPRQIALPAAFAQNSSALLQGRRSTIFDAGAFNALYVPLENAAGESFPRTGSLDLGDDSTLHCGDCHTVGQWKPASSFDRLGRPTTAAIGAHGSANEYLLRNSIGTDERHTQNAYTVAAGVVTFTNPGGAFLVCYNCHAYAAYGSVFNATGAGQTGGATGPHAGEYDQAGRCDGVGNTLPFNGYTTGTATDGTQFLSRFMGPLTKFSSPAPYAGEQNPDFGDIYGIQCLNCHNSGLGNAYGGIHGSPNNTAWNNGTTTIQPDPSVTGGAYIDGLGNTTKVERFLPGLGDAMHVPGTLGGYIGGSVVPTATSGLAYTYTTGGITRDTNWEQVHWQQAAGTVINRATGQVSGLAAGGAGCYTLAAPTGTGANPFSGADIIASDVTSGLRGPSVTGEGGAASVVSGTWGGCDDHTAGQGNANHGFLKRIVRPVTY